MSVIWINLKIKFLIGHSHNLIFDTRTKYSQKTLDLVKIKFKLNNQLLAILIELIYTI